MKAVSFTSLAACSSAMVPSCSSRRSSAACSPHGSSAPSASAAGASPSAAVCVPLSRGLLGSDLAKAQQRTLVCIKILGGFAAAAPVPPAWALPASRVCVLLAQTRLLGSDLKKPRQAVSENTLEVLQPHRPPRPPQSKTSTLKPYTHGSLPRPVCRWPCGLPGPSCIRPFGNRTTILQVVRLGCREPHCSSCRMRSSAPSFGGEPRGQANCSPVVRVLRLELCQPYLQQLEHALDGAGRARRNRLALRMPQHKAQAPEHLWHPDAPVAQFQVLHRIPEVLHCNASFEAVRPCSLHLASAALNNHLGR